MCQSLYMGIVKLKLKSKILSRSADGLLQRDNRHLFESGFCEMFFCWRGHMISGINMNIQKIRKRER